MGYSFWEVSPGLAIQADRDGRQLEFAAAYDKSKQKQDSLEMVEQYSHGHKGNISEETMKELSVRRATTNGFFFSFWILVKVSNNRHSIFLGHCIADLWEGFGVLQSMHVSTFLRCSV